MGSRVPKPCSTYAQDLPTKPLPSRVTGNSEVIPPTIQIHIPDNSNKPDKCRGHLHLSGKRYQDLAIGSNLSTVLLAILPALGAFFLEYRNAIGSTYSSALCYMLVAIRKIDWKVRSVPTARTFLLMAVSVI